MKNKKPETRNNRIQIMLENDKKEVLDLIKNFSQIHNGTIAYEIFIKGLAEILDKINCNLTQFDDYFPMIQEHNKGWTIQTIFKQTIQMNKLKEEVKDAE